MRRVLLAIGVCTLPYLSFCQFLPTSGTSGSGPIPVFGAGITAVPPESYGDPDAFVSALLQPNASGSARPSIQLGRNSSEAQSFQVDTAPLYNWRLNISNVTLDPSTPGFGLATGTSLVSGALELILPESEVERLANQNKTLELKLLYTSDQTDNKSQGDDGSCLQLMGSASSTYNLLLDFLAIDPIYSNSLIPESKNITRGDGYPQLASVNVSSEFLDLSLAPSSPGVSPDGFYGNDSQLRFLDFNGTASRASVNHVFYGNSSAAYYRSLRQILPIVVIERFINATDALNGTEIASISCVRPKDIAPGSLTLPADYWTHPEEALNVSSNVNATQAPGVGGGGGGGNAGNINQVSVTLGLFAVVVTICLQVLV